MPPATADVAAKAVTLGLLWDVSKPRRVASMGCDDDGGASKEIWQEKSGLRDPFAKQELGL